MSNQESPISAVPVARPGEPIVSTRAISSGGYEGFRLPVAVLLDNVRSMYNVGAFFRAADGVGLQKLCLAGITAHPPKKAISKTALGAENDRRMGARLGCRSHGGGAAAQRI